MSVSIFVFYDIPALHATPSKGSFVLIEIRGSFVHFLKLPCSSLAPVSNILPMLLCAVDAGNDKPNALFRSLINPLSGHFFGLDCPFLRSKTVRFEFVFWHFC
jgi:hypothetical protein